MKGNCLIGYPGFSHGDPFGRIPVSPQEQSPSMTKGFSVMIQGLREHGYPGFSHGDPSGESQSLRRNKALR